MYAMSMLILCVVLQINLIQEEKVCLNSFPFVSADVSISQINFQTGNNGP